MAKNLLWFSMQSEPQPSLAQVLLTTANESSLQFYCDKKILRENLKELKNEQSNQSQTHFN